MTMLPGKNSKLNFKRIEAPKANFKRLKLMGASGMRIYMYDKQRLVKYLDDLSIQ